MFFSLFLLFLPTYPLHQHMLHLLSLLNNVLAGFTHLLVVPIFMYTSPFKPRAPWISRGPA